MPAKRWRNRLAPSTASPHTMPLYSRMRRPSTVGVVVTITGAPPRFGARDSNQLARVEQQRELAILVVVDALREQRGEQRRGRRAMHAPSFLYEVEDRADVQLRHAARRGVRGEPAIEVVARRRAAA